MSTSNTNLQVYGPAPFKLIPNHAHCTKCDKGDSTTIDLEWCNQCWAAKYCSEQCRTADSPDHKTNCKNENYVLLFEDLDRALKIAFGWHEKGSAKEYGFAVWNRLWGTAAFEQNRKAHEAHSRTRMNDEIMYMTPETKNWVEFDTPTAKTFQELPWVKGHYTNNELPSESRTVGHILEDERFNGGTFEDCLLSYDYDVESDADFHHAITPVQHVAPTKSFQCLHGAGLGFDQDRINGKLAAITVRGYKRNLGAGYSGV